MVNVCQHKLIYTAKHGDIAKCAEEFPCMLCRGSEDDTGVSKWGEDVALN